MTKTITIIVFNYANKYMYMLIQLHKVTSQGQRRWGGAKLIPQKVKHSKIKVTISKTNYKLKMDVLNK